MVHWVFFSSKSGNTAKLLRQAGLSGARIPVAADEPMPEVCAPFVLLTPSFGDATGRGAVPKAVIRFLNHPDNRRWLRGVVGCGDRNFGSAFAQAGLIVANKCQVPLLHRAEMAGNQADWLRLQALDRQLQASQAWAPAFAQTAALPPALAAHLPH